MNGDPLASRRTSSPLARSPREQKSSELEFAYRKPPHDLRATKRISLEASGRIPSRTIVDRARKTFRYFRSAWRNLLQGRLRRAGRVTCRRPQSHVAPRLEYLDTKHCSPRPGLQCCQDDRSEFRGETDHPPEAVLHHRIRRRASSPRPALPLSSGSANRRRQRRESPSRSAMATFTHRTALDSRRHSLAYASELASIARTRSKPAPRNSGTSSPWCAPPYTIPRGAIRYAARISHQRANIFAPSRSRRLASRDGLMRV